MSDTKKTKAHPSADGPVGDALPSAVGRMQDYDGIHHDIVALLESARRSAARSVNSLIAASYWAVGQRIVEFEQGGKDRAAYGDALIQRLSTDLSARFGCGFIRQNLQQMRMFYQAWPMNQIRQTLSAISGGQAPLAQAFPLPWSAYVRLLSLKSPGARNFYETEALRCGWSVRQLDRQINSQFYERIALSRNKAAMLRNAEHAESGDAITPEQALKDPFVLEFLNLKDEYSESDLEETLIEHLADFLLELGDDLPLSAASAACGWTTSGSGSTCCSFIAS